MNIGVIGLGKLGLPMALAIESKGHKVCGYDVNFQTGEYLRTHKLPYKEEGLQPLLDANNIRFYKLITGVIRAAELIFVTVQTPHDPQYEGVTILPDTRSDFNYDFLVAAITDIAQICEREKLHRTVVVISTCLPGTFKREIEPLLNKYIDYVYSPQFIAMGTVLHDYLNPEFALMGLHSGRAAKTLHSFYKTIHDKPHLVTDITTAEGIKVFYNTFITAKTLLANSWMQVSHKTGMNVDDITKALSLATDRLISPKYLKGGGPDSGGCHPRDLIALSWLGKEIDMKPNWFEIMATTRDLQTEWTADLIAEQYMLHKLPVYIFGKAFKPETNLVNGSGSTLLANILKSKGISVKQYDPIVDNHTLEPHKGIYFIATAHKVFSGWNYPIGSVIMDLWRCVKPPDNCLYIPIGNPHAIQDKRRKVSLR